MPSSQWCGPGFDWTVLQAIEPAIELLVTLEYLLSCGAKTDGLASLQSFMTVPATVQ